MPTKSQARVPPARERREWVFQRFRLDEVTSSPPRLYERKAALVNVELDAMGLGRYQKCIWVLCGFGYGLDLLWAQAFGLSEPHCKIK